MKLVYLSLDELNQSLVRHWSQRMGVRVECPSQADDSLEDRHTAVLIDMDQPPPGTMEKVLARLDVGGDTHHVIAHGYGWAGEELRNRGVAVFPRLRSRILHDLATVTRSIESALRHESDALTWVPAVYP